MDKHKAEVVFIDRKDLNRRGRNKSINNILLTDISSYEVTKESEIIIFVDNDGNQRILKNRFLGWTKKDEKEWANEEYSILAEQEKNNFGDS